LEECYSEEKGTQREIIEKKLPEWVFSAVAVQFNVAFTSSSGERHGWDIWLKRHSLSTV
jgi:hypothetical protein